MLEQRPIDEVVVSMRRIGERLISFNFPKVPASLLQEDDLVIFKKRSVIVDGYNIDIHYQKSDFEEYLTETLQIYSQYSPFLPFNVVVKLAKKFLGGHDLSLVEIYKDGRKIYVWTVYLDREGRPLKFPFDFPVENCDFDGITYSYMQPTQVYIF